MIILVVNLGLKSVRCIAFSLDGVSLASSSQPVQTFVSNEKVEQNPTEWFQLTQKVIRDVTLELGKRAQDISYITVTTSASCLVVLDSKGHPLRNSILVSDTRSISEARILAHTVEFQAIHHKTGYKSSPDLMIPKIMWLAKHEQDIYHRAQHFLNAGDYLNFLLTGRYITDPNNAMKFHYVLPEHSYPVNLFSSLGIDVEKFPEVRNMGEDLGTILPGIASELGIPNTCHVILSTYDALAAVTGTGAFEIGEAVDVSGTVTSFRAVSEHNLFDPKQRFYVTPHLKKKYWLAGGSNNLGGGIIEWLRQLFFKNHPDPYEDLEAEVKSQPPCPGGLIFLPHLLGERTPIWDPNCRGVFFGLNRSHGRPQIIRAVFEGAAFSVRHIAEVLKEYHVPINKITVSGGLSRLDVMNQVKADILGVPIQKLKNFETTAIGAALISLVGIGVYNNGMDGFKQFCEIERTFEPDTKKHLMYNDFFSLYLNIYDSLKETYIQRAEILRKMQNQGIDELVITENL